MSGEACSRIRAFFKILWILSLSICGLYLIIVYLLPLIITTFQPSIPSKMSIELFICVIPLIIGIFLTFNRIRHIDVSISLDQEFLIIGSDDLIAATCCLELSSVPSSIIIGSDEQAKYDTSMLLAIRGGMSKLVNMAYEVGVFESEPFLRIFISAVGHSKTEIYEILRREATRTEAIVLACLPGIELHQLENENLKDAVTGILDCNIINSSLTELHIEDYQKQSIIILKGSPRIIPTTQTSQIGTFIETLLRKGFSASLTCVFSPAKPGREKRKLEGKWKIIREKERKNEDSLKDQSMKRDLLNHYQRIQGNESWFDSTVYLKIREDSKSHLQTTQEAICGLVSSIWEKDDSMRLSCHSLSKRTVYRLLMKRHLKKQRVHVSELAAFVNTPVQQLPIIAPIHYPSFKIPAKGLVDNELSIGYAIYSGNKLHKVGLKPDWLREHVAILGTTGTGKTTVVKQLMAKLSQSMDIPWWIFDVKGSEYTDLLNCSSQEVLLIRPGIDSSFVIDLMDSDLDLKDRHAHTTFGILCELLKERGASSELSPAMEKLLREAILEVVTASERNNSIQDLFKAIVQLAGNDRVGKMTKDALLNRLEILRREPLGSILRGGENAIRISNLMNKRIIFDLRHVAQVGGMDSARLLYNLVAKWIFDYALQRGIKEGIHHVVVLEEANNLVPESYTRNSAADITTGESMVMLQRATGQGVIVISTRPNISSNILANTATKIVFRLPYDSTIGGKFLSLNDEQEQYLRRLNRGRALIVIPNTEAFEIETIRFYISIGSCSFDKSLEIDSEYDVMSDLSMSSEREKRQISRLSFDNVQDDNICSTVLDRIGELASHTVAFLASQGVATKDELNQLLYTLDSQINKQDLSDLIRDLVSLGSIERESLSLVPGGVLYTLPGKGIGAVENAIARYIKQKIIEKYDVDESSVLRDGSRILFDDKSILIIPERPTVASINNAIERIRDHMNNLGNEVTELILIVRGSVAAAKIRNLIETYEGFDAVNVVSAFPSSLDKMINDLIIDHHTSAEITQTKLVMDENQSESIELIDAVHEGDATSRAMKMRLWFGIIQEFVELSGGLTEWRSILEFIETTALQSSKGRAVPLTVEDGRKALTELLADEMLVALRVGKYENFVDLDRGIWIVNSVVLKSLKEKAIESIKKEFRKRECSISHGHGYYDFCVDNKSYVVFPTQQEMNTLLRLHSDVACRICNSKGVVCILTAKEYLDESIPVPSNLTILTVDIGITEIPT
ncbi:MAG: DUF87 domain-containing protein [Candidatus Thorarchaeota archaeon]|jgi:DNA-binding HxlR family transcriptional regulator